MSLPPGSRVGIYEVVELIGVGGMGEVYRATDSRLDRLVAIKTLPEGFAADADRLARFEREAKVLAQLNHPHIASIYGLETGTPTALAMEMVEGETLAQRIAGGPIPMDEALLIARQIAEALEHAHGKGIIHRDLKPANIKAGPREAAPLVKVLDFGLAKAMSPDAAGMSSSALSSPTITSPATLTRAGIVLGTAAYMSPEQARGRHVDQRADIWAFGCVVFEMISGRRAFDGEETADVMARVIQSEPDWHALPASTPQTLRTLLQHCLRKDLHQRLHSIADARIELDEMIAGTGPEISPAPVRRRFPWVAGLSGLAIGASLVGATLLLGTSRHDPPPPAALRFDLLTPEGLTLYRSGTSGRLNFAISPDGQKLAAVLVGKDAVRHLFIRRLSETGFRQLPGTENADAVFWAPDSTRLGFATSAGIRQTDLSGGASRTMVTLPGFTAAGWGPNNVIVAGIGPSRPLYRWSADGSTATPLASLPADVVGRYLSHWIPGEDRFFFTDYRGNSQWTLRLQDAQGQIRDVRSFESTLGGSSVEYDADRVLLSVTEPSGRTVVTAQQFDRVASRLVGESTVILTGTNQVFSVSTTGTLVYGDILRGAERFEWLNARGQPSNATPALEQTTNFDLSPDERFLVMQSNGVLLHDLARGVTTVLASQGGDPVFSPDGREIAYAVTTNGFGIHVIPAFGGQSRRIYEAKEPVYTEDWSSDGQTIAAVYRYGDALLIPVNGGAPPIRIETKTPNAAIDEPRFSPDGHWISYGVNRTGSGDVFLSPVPPTGERWQISVAGGAQGRWRADGRSLYFLSLTGTMMRVDVELVTGATPRISAPVALFETGLQVEPTLDQFEVSKDGGRFILRRPDAKAVGKDDTLHVIVNWTAALLADQK